MDRHELGNMIFNLEDKKNLKEVKFTKSAVKEVLGYLKELYEIKNKEHEEDRRVALAEKDQAIESLQEINQSLGQTCNNDAKEIERLNKLLTEKEKEIEIEKKVSDWLYNIHNRTKFEEEVTQKCKTATEITKQCNLYEHCKNQYINDLRSEVKKKLKD